MIIRSKTRFRILWREKVPAAWKPTGKVRRRLSRWVSDGDIASADDKIDEQDRTILINIWFFLNGMIGEDRVYNMRQIEQGIEQDSAYSQLRGALDYLREDMRHYEDAKLGELRIRRLYTGTGIPWKGPLDEQDDPKGSLETDWILFLNEPDAGGEIYFPTRRVYVPPKAGTVVRWPRGVPSAVVPVESPLFLLHGSSSSLDEAKQSDWNYGRIITPYEYNLARMR